MTEQQMRHQGESRKAKSIARLKAEGIPTIDHLPWIECDPATLQSRESIARRGMVISLLAVYAEPNGMPRDMVLTYLGMREVMNHLTAKEQAFLAKAELTDSDRGPFTWQYESAYVLLWALGYFDSLGSPTRYCTAPEVSAVVAPRSVMELLANARLRSPEEIFDEADLIFRYHWAARDATLNRKPVPGGLIAPVCYYRHYALNWLTDLDADWDSVDTGT